MTRRVYQALKKVFLQSVNRNTFSIAGNVTTDITIGGIHINHLFYVVGFDTRS